MEKHFIFEHLHSRLLNTIFWILKPIWKPWTMIVLNLQILFPYWLFVHVSGMWLWTVDKSFPTYDLMFLILQPWIFLFLFFIHLLVIQDGWYLLGVCCLRVLFPSLIPICTCWKRCVQGCWICSLACQVWTWWRFIGCALWLLAAKSESWRGRDLPSSLLHKAPVKTISDIGLFLQPYHHTLSFFFLFPIDLTFHVLPILRWTVLADVAERLRYWVSPSAHGVCNKIVLAWDISYG